MILAVLSVVGGWVGIPQILGGENRFEQWLEPVFGHREGSSGARYQLRDKGLCRAAPEAQRRRAAPWRARS